MALKVQEFLRNGGTLEQLEEQYGIVAKRGKNLWLVLLKYDIGSPMSEEIVQECRGLILDSVRNWDVVSFPYKKFFNVHEGHAAAIDWSTAKVYEKLDGSLCTLYRHQDGWHVSTSGTPDANCLINDTDKTFAQLFWETWKVMGYPDPDTLLYDHCYMFELCAKENQIIVQHREPKLVLHGIRSLVEPYPEIDPWNWAPTFTIAQRYPLTGLPECIAAAEALNPLQNEGYVVVDGNFNRIKIKSLKYVALHHIKSDFSERRMLELIRLGEVPELLSYFPEMAEQLDAMTEKHRYLCDFIFFAYAGIRGQVDSEKGDVVYTEKEERKRFAMLAKDSPYRAVLFAMYDGSTMKEAIDRLPLDTVLCMLKEIS